MFVLSASKLIRNGYCYLRIITSVKIRCPVLFMDIYKLLLIGFEKYATISNNLT